MTNQRYNLTNRTPSKPRKISSYQLPIAQFGRLFPSAFKRNWFITFRIVSMATLVLPLPVGAQTFTQ